MPNTNDSDNEESYSVDSTKPEEDDRPSNEVEEEEIEDVDNSAEKSRIFKKFKVLSILASGLNQSKKFNLHKRLTSITSH